MSKVINANLQVDGAVHVAEIASFNRSAKFVAASSNTAFVASTEKIISGLEGITFPDAPAGTTFAVTVTIAAVSGSGTGGTRTTRLRVGPAGNLTDTVAFAATHYLRPNFEENRAFPRIPVTPDEGDKLTVSFETPDTPTLGGNPSANTRICSVLIEQIVEEDV